MAVFDVQFMKLPGWSCADLVRETHGSLSQCVSVSLIDLGSVLTAFCIVFFSPSLLLLTYPLPLILWSTTEGEVSATSGLFGFVGEGVTKTGQGGWSCV
eukprot:1157123-Pelagomonas_calceolata.AAC.1